MEKPDSRGDVANDTLGYKSELPRSINMMSILGLSFFIIPVPFGLSVSLTCFFCILYRAQY
jgi:hypothetical protein